MATNDEPVNVRTNAVAALALFSVLCFLPIPAIVLGVIGGIQVRQRRGYESGEVMSRWAVLLGFLELVAWYSIYLSVIAP